MLGCLGVWKLHQQVGKDMLVIREESYLSTLDSGYLDTLFWVQSGLDDLEMRAVNYSGTINQVQKRELIALADSLRQLNTKFFQENRKRILQDSIFYLTQKRLNFWDEILQLRNVSQGNDPELENFAVKGTLGRNEIALPDSIPIEDDIAIFKWVFSKKYRKAFKKRRKESVEKVLLDWQETVLSEEGEPEIRELPMSEQDFEVDRVSLEEHAAFLELFYENKFYANKMDFYVQKIMGTIHGGALEKQSVILRNEAENSLANTFNYLFQLLVLLGAGIFLSLAMVGVTHRIYQRRLQRREAFVSKVVHEIKNTLHPIIGFASTLDQSTSQVSAKDILWTVKEESQHLLYLANGILDLSKIRRNEFALKTVPFVFQETVNKVIDSHRLEAREKGIELNVRFGSDLPKVLIGDPDRLKQILRNVVANAIKHTEEGSVSMEVHLAKVKISKAYIEFSITDTGKGLSKRELRKISRFRQFNTLGDSGVGLGLAIAYQLVRQHKGKIKLKSEGIDQGTSVFISLPYPIGAMQDILFLPAKKHVPETHLNQANILLVDDDPMNLGLTRTWLNDMGGRVHSASNGREAQKLLIDIVPELIILDLHMPEMDGKEFIKWLRAESGIEVPVLICSGDAEEALLKEIGQYGISDYISKPYGKEELSHKILALLPSHIHFLNQGKAPEKVEPEGPDASPYIYAIQKLNQEVGSNEVEVHKKLKLLTEVCRDNLHILYQGIQSKDAQLMNKALHKMVVICRYMGKDFELKQADLENRTQSTTLKQETLVLSQSFYHLMRNEVEKLDAYLSIQAPN